MSHFLEIRWLRTSVIAGFAMLHLILWWLKISPFFPAESSMNLWVSWFFALALMLPFSSAATVFFLWSSSVFALNFLGYLKLKFLNYPLSEYDFKAIASAPFYCFDAIFGYGKLRYVVLFVVALFLFLVIKFRRLPYAGNHKKLLHKILAIFCALTIFCLHYSAYQKYLENKLSNDSSDNLDALGTIAYSGSRAFYYNTDSLLRKDDKHDVVTEKEVAKAAKKYLNFSRKNISEKNKPNIVFVLAESTFDINDVFLLKKPYRDNSLFYAQENERYGKLGVAITGGRTWVTEFETISGLSARALGSRDYINDSVTPHLRNSFAIYLKEKGYDTLAFLPTIGALVNSTTVYMKDYGFAKFEDANTLNLDRMKIRKTFDSVMMQHVVKKFPDAANPFFSYVVLLQNHGPHDCEKTQLSDNELRLLADDDFKKNCQLDEFINRAKFTESALATLKTKMEAIEKISGRPFLIVVFGDHQPWTFNEVDYNTNRIKGSSRFTTFYKIIKSEKLPWFEVPQTMPANLLPTLVSSIFAKKTDKLYMPQNFYLFEKCGVINDEKQCQKALNSRHLDYNDYFSF